jgi:hypothetical protein
MEIAGPRLPGGSWWDWEVSVWDGCLLRPAAGHDLTYHHGLQVIFTDPGFVSCPSAFQDTAFQDPAFQDPAFQDPVFREPTVEETARLRRALGGTPPVVPAFEADAGGPGPVSRLIAAQGLDILPGLVQRHPRARAQAACGRRDWPGPPLPTD